MLEVFRNLQYLPLLNIRPVQCQSELSPLFSRKAEHSLYEGCILWDPCVVVLTYGKEVVSAVLHDMCVWLPGIKTHQILKEQMSGLKCMYMWRPGIITHQILREQTKSHMCVVAWNHNTSDIDRANEGS